MQPISESEKVLTVKEIREFLGPNTISISKIYLLIEKGELTPAYRNSGSRGTCVPFDVVLEYKNSRKIDVGA